MVDNPALSKLSPEIIKKYEASRNIQGKYLCHAPFSNIYFNVMGQGAACWLTFYGAPKYPEQSLREIWFGQYFGDLRKRITAGDFLNGCQVCARNIERGLYRNALAQAYDVDRPLGRYPRIMEFELSNRCNLECVMCNGRLSSSIRKGRENLPPIASPYDDEFVRQLEEFIPHLESARFNGGEPMLQKECLQIWERIIEIKPSVEITIATNGTVWSSKIEKMLKRGRFAINLSLDGATAKTYESIRKNSKFKIVVANARKFADYCREAGTTFSIMFNPMRVNWHEMGDLVEFCNENDYHIWFNTVYRPFELALWTLSSKELFKIQNQLSKYEFTLYEKNSVCSGNIEKFQTFVQIQLKTWANEQLEREKKQSDYQSKKREKANSKLLMKEKLRIAVGEERFPKIWLKMEGLETKVSKNIASQNFYHLFNERPIDWVIYDLESRSDTEVVEELYTRAEYY